MPVPKNKKVVSTAPKKRGPKAASQTCPRLNKGTILTDLCKKEWILGEAIGQGGFGIIYLARAASDNPKEEFDYVVKIEPHENGPLYCEMHFYQRVAKADMIEEWRKSNGLSTIGVPRYVASGRYTVEGTQLRFLVIDRFGDDLHKIMNQSGLRPATALKIGVRVLDILHYIHEKEYVHADIKALNILKGRGRSNDVHLLDYGLAYRYTTEGTHRPEKPDFKWKHNGTLEFCARDSHNGLPPSRRGDLECLLYNVITWMGNTLPWISTIGGERTSPAPEAIKEKVAQSKRDFMRDPKKSLRDLGMEKLTELVNFACYVGQLTYDGHPHYKRLRKNLLDSVPRVSQESAAVAGQLRLDWSALSPPGKRQHDSIGEDKNVESGKRVPAKERARPKVKKLKEEVDRDRSIIATSSKDPVVTSKKKPAVDVPANDIIPGLTDRRPPLVPLRSSPRLAAKPSAKDARAHTKPSSRQRGNVDIPANDIIPGASHIRRQVAVASCQTSPELLRAAKEEAVAMIQ